ncbi:amidohydrolase family protein [Candidatus Poribacteria bacterium]
MIAFADLPFIDCHFHMHMLIDQVNKANMHVSRDDPDKASVMDLMELCNLNAINIVSSTGAMGDEEHMNENLIAALAKTLYPGKIYAFGGLHHQWPGVSAGDLDYAKQARRLRDIGFDGIKMIEGKPTVRRELGKPLYSPAFDDYYGFLEAEQFPLLLHVGDPEGFWNPGGQYSNSEFVGREELYDEADRVLARFPALQIIFAHFYFMASDMDRSAVFLDKWPGISFDLTPGPTMYVYFSKEPEKWREFFTEYQDRILFGTDNHGEKRNFGPGAPDEYWPTPKITAMRTFLETDKEFRGWHSDLRGICLEKEVLEKIYCKNFQRYAGKTPKELNVGLALGECERITDSSHAKSVISSV